ncbi:MULTISPECIES: SLC13 family permease [unclassified Colwellia]|uniref:SLC13 family permease n=1 Tax=unclassified Colwellia TaxID=196834 RepID=UPI0015F7122A|nr:MULTISPECIES: SLC13 family permease [unclassified Colwellia]MBA6223871.1 SLC13 family permease [Colwellia sp. MB3u-45]MBA6267422.1 SLC13 family permease [Colwellia sp. MB3u-43]MBA6289337.1 SLC13 family permease [Colwellia sp. MB3u-4]MBA6297439.1 SLC13 family permease [Colwellia sp. MB02u-9]MBA6320052.1 SLC13 family permease [Colwellia sp. MB02u-19]
MNIPELPNNHALAVLLITVLALYLFRREDTPLETSSLAVIAILSVMFAVFPFYSDGKHFEPSSLFFGFGHEALVTVCSLMIIGHGIVRTGALEPIGRYLAKLWKISPTLSLLITLILAGGLSAFINNTPVVVLLLPILISVSLRTKTDSSPMLLPMGLATLVGGMATTIGTSTNLLVVSIAKNMGAAEFGLFDFAKPALMASVVAVLYLWLIAPRLLPRRAPSMPDTSPRIFSAYLNINENSLVNEKTITEIIALTDGQIKIESIQRGPENRNIIPLPDTLLVVGDRLKVHDYPDRLKEYETVLGATLFSGLHKVDDEHPLKAEKQTLAEIVIIAGSGLEGRTLQQANFIRKHAITVVALHRAGKAMEIGANGIGNSRLQIGDVLLVQGETEQISLLKSKPGLLIIDGAESLPQTKKAPLALGTLLAVVVSSALGILPIEISSVCGVLILLVTKCLDWQEAASALSTQVILIVAASLALGSAMMITGGAEYIAQVFVALSFGLPPGGILAALMLLLAILTNIVSNNAAAVIGTPIAISVASQLNLSPEPFILAVLFGANLSYATPMAYKTNLLVMNAGGYKFSDFMRIGIPLILLMWVTLSLLLNWLYL